MELQQYKRLRDERRAQKLFSKKNIRFGNLKRIAYKKSVRLLSEERAEIYLFLWCHGPAVMTTPCHGVNRGSTPRGTAINENIK